MHFPIPEAGKDKAGPGWLTRGGLTTFEPRVSEMEDIALLIAAGCSVIESRNYEFHFSRRLVKFSDSPDLCDDDEKTSAIIEWKGDVKKVHRPVFIQAILVGGILRGHDATYSFYKRAVADVNERRYIEAFYNLFFVLEYLYGNGKSGLNQAIEEMAKSKELVRAIVEVSNGNDLNGLCAPDFILRVRGMTPKEVMDLLVRTRGHLHHPNKSRSGVWHPEKQHSYQNITLLTHSICVKVVMQRYLTLFFYPVIRKAYKKAERCIRVDRPIRIVTR